ncbi:MAG TPA: M56 family metallopeptidase, partial [Longimicrobium sp.]
MTAHWMLYCAAVAVLLGLGALAAERALAAFGRPTRWAWAAALFLSLAVPAAARLFPRQAPPAPAAPKVAAASAGPAAAAGGTAVPLELPARLDLAALDRPLLVGWGTASGLALLALAAMAAVLERRRRRWRPARVSGEPVLVSPDTGPAVVGLFRSRIVFPEWAYAAGEEVRALMLEHEREHVRARDPLLLAGALAVAALLPWSPAVWWQLRRLRLSVEVDCDARVLRRRSDLRAYGALLLEVGRRAGRSRLALAAFSEPTSFLERRIHAMTAPRVRQPWLRAAGFGAAAAALLAAACEAPGPLQPAPADAERVYSAPGAAAGVQPAALTPREAIARFYPDVLTKGADGGARLLFVLSPAGEVVRHELQPGAVELREGRAGARMQLRSRRY